MITVTGEDDALALLEWLNSDDDVRGRAVLHRQVGGGGTMGSVALDTVSLLLSGGGLAALATSVVAYLQTRGRQVKITATVGDRSATIEGDRLNRRDLAELQAAALDMAKQLGED